MGRADRILGGKRLEPRQRVYAPIIEAETHRLPLRPSTASRRDPSANRELFPVLAPSKDGPAERWATSVLGGAHPVLVFAIVMLVGLAATAASRSASGSSSPGCSSTRGVWAGPTSASRSGSPTIGTGVDRRLADRLDHRRRRRASVLAGSIMVVCRALRKWRIAAFVVFALAVESASYRATTLVVHSHRPSVPRLEHLAGERELPVGPYGGGDRGLRRPRPAAHLPVQEPRLPGARLDDRGRNPVFVAISRMYRGMHHPLDVAGGVLVGDRRPDRACFRLPGGGRRRGIAAQEATSAGRGDARRLDVNVAVIAHAGKTLGGGLAELRRVLEAEGITTRSGARCRRAARHRRRSSGC